MLQLWSFCNDKALFKVRLNSNKCPLSVNPFNIRTFLPAKIEMTGEQGDVEVRQLELYKDDSVVVCYSDGSKLLISPCGASFLHVDHKPRGVTTANKTHQTTRHAVSQYRNKLRCALEFRNKFAERPFFCEWYCDSEKEVRNYVNC